MMPGSPGAGNKEAGPTAQAGLGWRWLQLCRDLQLTCHTSDKCPCCLVPGPSLGLRGDKGHVKRRLGGEQRKGQTGPVLFVRSLESGSPLPSSISLEAPGGGWWGSQ